MCLATVLWCRFDIFKDHMPLTYALARVSITVQPLDGTPVQAAVLCGRTHVGHLPHITGADNMVADTLNRPPGHAVHCVSCTAMAGASLGGDLWKVPSGSQVAALQERQTKLISTFTDWRGRWHGGHAAGCRHLFSQDGGQPGQLSK
jgi:hypothetical protein